MDRNVRNQCYVTYFILYLGLFLGYTILQAPMGLMAIWAIVKNIPGLCFGRGNSTKIDHKPEGITDSKSVHSCWNSEENEGINTNCLVVI